MVIKEYLERINYAGPLQPVAQVLKSLHTAHMRTVPFENLDVHLGRPIHLDQNSLYDKIVRRKRGGFCYELNGLLGALLTQIGFQVDYLSVRAAQKQDQLSAEYDHLALRVGCPNDPGNFWLADVGWGASRKILKACVNITRLRPNRSLHKNGFAPWRRPQGESRSKAIA